MKKLIKRIEFLILLLKIKSCKFFSGSVATSRVSRRVIWVYGPSSVGKKTLIFKLANSGGRRGPVANVFGICSDDLVVPVVIPTRLVGKDEGEKEAVISRRYLALRSIYMSEVPAVWVVHMQAVDLRENIAARIISAFPGVSSECYYLDVDEQKYLQRYKKGVVSHAQAYRFKEEHLGSIAAVFGGVVKINI